MLLAAFAELSDWHEGEYKSFLAPMSEVSLHAFRSSASTEEQTQPWFGAYLTNLGITVTVRVSFSLLILVLPSLKCCLQMKANKELIYENWSKEKPQKKLLPTVTNQS